MQELFCFQALLTTGGPPEFRIETEIIIIMARHDTLGTVCNIANPESRCMGGIRGNNVQNAIPPKT